MKNKLISILLLMAILFTNIAMAAETKLAQNEEEVAAALQAAGLAQNDILDIREKMFLTTVYDIYFNFDNYRGKAIAIEGMFNTMGNVAALDGYDDVYMIYRRSPGCCGNDGFDGYELRFEGEKPQLNDWIKVWGILRDVKTDGPLPQIYLEVVSMQVLAERGAEFVDQ